MYRLRYCWGIYVGNRYGFYMGGKDPDDHRQGVLVADGLASDFFKTPQRTGRVNLFFARWRFACFTTPEGGIGLFNSRERRFVYTERAKEKCRSHR